MTNTSRAPLTTSPAGIAPSLVDLLVFAGALIVFGLTLAPGLQPADSGEYQLTGAVLGIAHPPGYAAYTLVSWLFASLLPVAPALAINALSAVLGAIAVTLIGAAARTFTGSRWAGLAAALTLAVSTTFWAQATYANVRMPTAAAIALAVYCIARLRKGSVGGKGEIRSPLPPTDPLFNRWLALTSFALGLAVSHHGSTVFLAAVLGVYALSLVPEAWRRPWPLLAGLIPFLAWLYVPLNADGPGAPGGLDTWSGAWGHILARGFQGDMLAFATVDQLPERLRVLGVMLTFQWNPLLLTLIALGGALAAWADRRLGLALWLAWLVHTFIGITYRAPQTTEYLLPSYVLMALATGWGGGPRAGAGGGGHARVRPLRSAPHLSRLPSARS
jgi:4-amino-4-deoxy-L-arabinose transferase-like glycosyltransferase